MSTRTAFRPKWSSAPGETIRDLLTERCISIEEFSLGIEETIQRTMEILEGRSAITIGVARKLERFLGASVQFWMTRDFQFREDAQKQSKAALEWLRELPLSDMVRFGWLKPAPLPSEEVASCLQFFDVPSISEWRSSYGTYQRAYALRTSPSFDSSPGALAAWLRAGEIAAASIRCGPWNPQAFHALLPGLRALTREKNPDVFLLELRKLCASAGVAFAVLRCPSGCRASGAARLLDSKQALLLLSFRYLSDDQFWFSFFHEAGHLLLHADRGVFIDGLEVGSSDEEREANEFAGKVLVPEDVQHELLQLQLDHRAIIRFASRIGVSPGIVVGQLQHRRRITPRQLNALKRRYRWSE
jgi:plasmid maintenance system antidote protein VapI